MVTTSPRSLMRVEDDADVELLAEGGLDADLDVVEVDEDGDVETILMRQNEFLRALTSRAVSVRPTAAGDVQPAFAAVELASLRVRRRTLSRRSATAGLTELRRAQFDAVSGGGASGVGQTTRVNWPRCSSSRPLPPRPVTSYFAVLIVCSAPRVVSTVSRSRSPVDAMNAEHAVVVAAA